MIGLGRDEMRALLTSSLDANWERVAALQDPAVEDLIRITMDALADLLSANNERFEQELHERIKAAVSELLPEIL